MINARNLFNFFNAMKGKKSLQLHRVLRIKVVPSLYALRLRLLHPRSKQRPFSQSLDRRYLCVRSTISHFSSPLLRLTFFHKNLLHVQSNRHILWFSTYSERNSVAHGSILFVLLTTNKTLKKEIQSKIKFMK